MENKKTQKPTFLKRNRGKLILTGIIAALTISFIIQNNDPVVVYFWFWSFESALTFILFLTCLIGFLFGYFARGRKKKENNTQTEKK